MASQASANLGLLESALARPQHRYSYGTTSLAELAASLAYGISRNHPFVDGNTRASLVVAELLLELNGVELAANDEECVVTCIELAAGKLSEERLAAWIQTHTR